MKYMGSKNRIAKFILPIMLEEANKRGVTTWVEPFCLSKDTTVFTESGIKKLSDISIEDTIYSDGGTLARVVRKIKSPVNNGLKITMKGGVKIVSTQEHKFYLSSGGEILAKDLRIGDELLTGNSEYCEDIVFDMSKHITRRNPELRGSRGGSFSNDKVRMYHSAKEINRFVKVDEDFCWALGLVIADGSGGSITLHENEVSLAEKFLNIYKKITGLNFDNEKCYYYRDGVRSLQVAVPFQNIYKRIFFHAPKIGYGARNKNMSIAFKLNKGCVLSLIEGMHCGDGCVRKKGIYRGWNYKTSSRTLAKQLQAILSIKLGLKSTLSYGINKERYIGDRMLKESDYYNISVNNNSSIRTLTREDNRKIKINEKASGFVVSKIDIAKEEFYDITLCSSTSHKFIIDGGIVTHNCGGGNMIDKVPNDFNRIGIDYNHHTIQALIAIRDMVDKLPENVSEEYYKEIRGSEPNPITSLIRFGASFGGKFENGYARSFTNKGIPRNHWAEARRNAVKQSTNLQGVGLIHGSYDDYSFINCLIYCDPPYLGTTSYKTDFFDHDKFWQWCRETSKSNSVFISEYTAPEDFTCIWEGTVKTNFASQRKGATHSATEKLFKL